MKHAAWLTLPLLCACAPLPVRQSIWEIETSCADVYPLEKIGGCMRGTLDAQYGPSWRSNPKPQALLNLIDFAAEKVASGEETEAHAKLVVSNFVASEAGAAEISEATRRAALGALGAAILQNSGPCLVPHSALTPCPVAAAPLSPPPAPVTCRTSTNPVSGTITTCN